MVSLHGLKSVVIRNYLSFKKLFKLSIFPNLFEYFLYLVAFGFGFGNMTSEFSTEQYIIFLSTGILISIGMTSSTNECLYNSFIQRKIEKTYDAMLMLPIKKLDIIFGQIIWSTVRSIIYGGMFYFVLVGVGILDINLVGYTFIFLIVTGLLFGTSAMIFSLLATDRNHLQYYSSIFIRTLYLFSGIFFVVDFLPDYIEIVVKYNPLYLLVNSYRNIVLNNYIDFNEIILIFGITSALFVIVAIIGRKVLNK